MSLDFPDSGTALWAIYDATGIRPEYLLPVLYSESGFQSVQNNAGYPYYGINQASAQMIANYTGLSPDQYLALPPSQQIAQCVSKEFANIQAQFGDLRSATRVYQANFLPATLGSVTTLDGVLAHQGDTNEWGAGNVYVANSGLDTDRKGTITLSDLANSVAKSASAAPVQDAIAQTYALRPSEIPQDPVYGTDFPTPSDVTASATGSFGLTQDQIVIVFSVSAIALLGYTAYTGDLQRFVKKVSRGAIDIPTLGKGRSHAAPSVAVGDVVGDVADTVTRAIESIPGAVARIPEAIGDLLPA